MGAVKIVFVAPWVPHSTRPRSMQLLKQLCEKHEVWLIASVGASEKIDHLEGLGLYRLTTVRRRRIASLIRTAIAFLRGGSLQVALLDEPEMRAHVSRCERDWKPDLFHFNVVRSAGALAGVNHTPVVFDLDEVRSDYYGQLIEGSASLMWRTLARIEFARLKRTEQLIASRSAVMLVSSPVDLGRLPGEMRLVRSPHELHLVDRGAPNSDVLFVGRLGYQANREALDWFVDEVWSDVLERRPDAQLCVVGENSERFPADPARRIVVKGKVPSLDEYYRHARVAIVPVTLGTGVQMKLIQALASGVPAITNTMCAERAGLGPEACTIADTPEQWAAGIAALFEDEALSSAHSDAGKDWAIQNYSDEAIMNSLYESYFAATGGVA